MRLCASNWPGKNGERKYYTTIIHSTSNVFPILTTNKDSNTPTARGVGGLQPARAWRIFSWQTFFSWGQFSWKWVFRRFIVRNPNSLIQFLAFLRISFQVIRKTNIYRRVILPKCDTCASTCPRVIGDVDVSNLNFLEKFYISGTFRFEYPTKRPKGPWWSTCQLIKLQPYQTWRFSHDENISHELIFWKWVLGVWL